MITDHIKECVLKATVNSVAEAFYLLNRGIYLYSDECGWFYLRSPNIWVATRSRNILKGMSAFILKYIKEMCELVFRSCEEGAALEKAKKRVESERFIREVAEALRGFYYKEDLHQLIYERQRGLFAFDDCVMDMRTFEVRPIEPEDYSMVSCGYSYREPRTEEVEGVRQMLQEAIPDEGLRAYLLQEVSKSLGGRDDSKPLHLLHGYGYADGVSTFLGLCRATFGRYFKEIRFDYLSSNWATTSKGPTPDVVDMQPSKFVLCRQPFYLSDRATLHSETLGVFGGRSRSDGQGQEDSDGQITCNRRYSRLKVKYTPQFTIWVDCDKIPIITHRTPEMDERIRLVVFPEVERGAGQRVEGRRMNEREKAYGFLGLLLEAARGRSDRSASDGSHVPEKVVSDTRRYLFNREEVTF